MEEVGTAVDPGLARVVRRAIEKRPDDRYQTPADLLRDLERIGRYNSLEADWSDWVG